MIIRESSIKTDPNNPDLTDTSVQHCFYDFCKQTILHGWHYLADLESDTESGDEENDIIGPSIPGSTHSTPDLGGIGVTHRHTFIDRSTNTVNQNNRVQQLQQHSDQQQQHAKPQNKPSCSSCLYCLCCLPTSPSSEDACFKGSDCCRKLYRSGRKSDYAINNGSSHPKTASELEEEKDRRQRRRRHSRRTAFRSAFWTLIVMGSVVSGGFFLHDNTSEFMNSTVQTTLDGSVPLTEVFFPSVVVCNINQIRKSFFAELGFYENDTLVRIMYEDFIKGTMDADERDKAPPETDPKRAAFYDVLKLYLEKRNLTVEGSITWLSHQNCDDMFIYSKWNGTTTYGFGANERDFGTDYGICCWYTPQLNFSAIPDGPDTDWAFWFNSVPRGAKTGKDNGFSVLFDIESYDYGYYDEGSEGLKVAIVHHLDMPIIRQRAFHVAPGTENQIPVTPTLYTTAPQALARFTPEQRDCYREDEIDLMYLPKSHGYRYEMSNCLFEAAFEKILERCHCAPGFHNEGGAAAYQQYPVCQGKQLTCSNNILNRMGEFNQVEDIIENKTKVCLANCEDQINDLFVTTSNYPNKKTFKEREEYCLLVKKLVKTCQSHKRLPLSADFPDLCPTLEALPNVVDYCGRNNRWRTEKLENKSLARDVETQIYLYARENLAIINIFIKEPYTKRFRKTEKMSRISYIASSGGLLGLCMGFSFVSLAEIAYHLFLCLSLLCKKRKSMICCGDVRVPKAKPPKRSSSLMMTSSGTQRKMSTSNNGGRDPYDRIEANGNR